MAIGVAESPAVRHCWSVSISVIESTWLRVDRQVGGRASVSPPRNESSYCVGGVIEVAT